MTLPYAAQASIAVSEKNPAALVAIMKRDSLDEKDRDDLLKKCVYADFYQGAYVLLQIGTSQQGRNAAIANYIENPKGVLTAAMILDRGITINAEKSLKAFKEALFYGAKNEESQNKAWDFIEKTRDKFSSTKVNTLGIRARIAYRFMRIINLDTGYIPQFQNLCSKYPLYSAISHVLSLEEINRLTNSIRNSIELLKLTNSLKIQEPT